MFGDADAYERFMGRWSRLVAPLLVEFAGIDDRGDVLDVGSGTGSLAFAILGLKPHCSVVGIDPSKEYVAYAHSRNSFGKRATFEVGDAQKLRFADATFENSLSLLVFNFIPDPSKALREVQRVTKAGGRIAAAVWDYGEGMRMLRVFWDAAVGTDPNAGARDEKHMPLCRAGELAELWDQSRLKNVEERSLEITTQFENFRDYWDAFLLKQGPAGIYAASLDRNRLQALRGEVKRRLGILTEDRTFNLPARVWVVRGTV
ncbi:MAG TPA: class I SAM-dependent methyltransferase [Acidobacteriota bacterium]|nr:class I SAM-dependent methyltransferase [Acidobacteriota bacterium]